MSDYIKLAQAYSKAGYSVIPIGSNKIPTIREWRVFQDRPMTSSECVEHFKHAYGMALLCGGKNNVTAIDFDLKYDLSGDVFDRYKSEIPNKLLKKMFVQKTQNNGFHFVFSCSDKIEGNQKLASRYTTADEKHQTYMKNYQNPLTRNKALKIAGNDKNRVIIETRGSGGYICISPTPGYSKVHGKIEEITVDEYNILMESARKFNEIATPRTDQRIERTNHEWKVSPFADYNQRSDILHVLQMNGWDTVGRPFGKSVRLKRSGQTHSTSSALFDTQSKILNVFSTSTSFDINRGYSPSDVFIHLECNDDVGQAFRKLVEAGYGEK